VRLLTHLNQALLFKTKILPLCIFEGVLGVACLLQLASCGSHVVPVDPAVLNGDEISGAGAKAGSGGGLFGANGLAFGINKNPKASTSESPGGGLPINAYLWRGALSTVSFMPLTSVDPYGGVIISDWYTPPGTRGERYKTVVYILGWNLTQDGVHVSVFKQTLQNGQWTSATSSPTVSRDIEDKILARALKLQASSG
jgi:hypothetical protein